LVEAGAAVVVVGAPEELEQVEREETEAVQGELESVERREEEAVEEEEEAVKELETDL